MFDSSYRLRLDPDADLAALRADARGALRRYRPAMARPPQRRAGDRPLRRPAGLVPGAGRSRRPCGRRRRGRRRGAGAPRGKTATIATLKTLGAGGGTIFAVYSDPDRRARAPRHRRRASCSARRCRSIAAPFAAARLPVPAEFGIYPRPLAEAAIFGGLTALLFTIWPLGARPRHPRRRALPRPGLRAAAPGRGRSSSPPPPALAAALVAAAVRFSGAPDLALYTAGGVAGALLVLLAAAAGLRRLARRLGRGRLTRGRPALRWALAALGGPSGETASVVLALGLGLSVLAAIGQIDWNLRTLVTRELPARAPAYFFIDIQNDQLEGFLDRAERHARRQRDRDRADAARGHHPDQRPAGARGRRRRTGCSPATAASPTPPPRPRAP